MYTFTFDKAATEIVLSGLGELKASVSLPIIMAIWQQRALQDSAAQAQLEKQKEPELTVSVPSETSSELPKLVSDAN